MGLEINLLDMGLFGGEKYSKENYKKVVKDETQNIKSLGGELLEIPEDEEREAKNSVLYDLTLKKSPMDKLYRKIVEAQARIDKMYGKGKEEAIALNEEYNHILVEAQKAEEAVKEFEKNKLGMLEEETKS